MPRTSLTFPEFFRVVHPSYDSAVLAFHRVYGALYFIQPPLHIVELRDRIRIPIVPYLPDMRDSDKRGYPSRLRLPSEFADDIGSRTDNGQ